MCDVFDFNCAFDRNVFMLLSKKVDFIKFVGRKKMFDIKTPGS